MSFMDDIRSETKKYGGGMGGDYFEFKEGVNQMRLLVQPKVIAYHFPPAGRPDVCVGIDDGCPHHKPDKEGKIKPPTIRLVTYIFDRDDGNKLKLAELPLSISYSINDLQKDKDYAFSEFPMEFDVKITHDPKNSDPKAKYRLVASPKFVPLTTEEERRLMEKMGKQTPEQFVERKKAKQVEQRNSDASFEQKGGDIEYPKDDINPDDIPF